MDASQQQAQYQQQQQQQQQQQDYQQHQQQYDQQQQYQQQPDQGQAQYDPYQQQGQVQDPSQQQQQVSDPYQDYLRSQEMNDGVRFTWNYWPHSRIEATRCVIPVAAFFTPLRERPLESPQPPPLHYDPVLCTNTKCKAVLNPFAQVDYRAKVWSCQFCNQRNPFPPHYAMIAEDNLPPELSPAFTTIEYTLTKATTMPPIFLFVVDTCLLDVELKALKESLQTSLSLLPVDALVGLISYGRMVNIHQLNSQGISRAYVFKGTKDVTAKQLQDILTGGFAGGARPGQGAQPGAQPIGQGAAQRPPPGPGGRPGMPPQQQQQQAPPPANQQPSNKFLQPINECDMSMNDLIEQLQCDPWPTAKGNRPKRATGAALAVAVTLLEVSYPNAGARIMLFTGGPCTDGPGMVVGEELKNPIRSWHTIKEESVSYIKKACKHYDALSTRAVNNGHAIDVFACALDQTGLHEMRNCYTMTNGCVVMADSFESTLFKQSYRKMFEKDAAGHLKMGLNAITELKCGKDIKIEGAIGACAAPQPVKNQYVSDTEFGIAGTCQWKFCSLTPRSTCMFLLEICGQHGAQLQPNSRGYIQFVTQYQHPSGQKRIRVTTTCREWADMQTQQQYIAYGFDQESSAVAMARLACWRATNESETTDALRWLDRSLIRLCQKFGQYQKDDPQSFVLSENFSLFPQSLFHMRRSQFLQVFNYSPDETSYYRHMLMSESVVESMTMLQPVLFAYSFNGPPKPVLLDSSSIQPDTILIMDDYFHVVIYHGKTIAQWKKEGYADDPAYESFKQLLEAPMQDALQLLVDRFPVPRFVVTEHEGSQARFLTSKVNPSITHNNPYGSETGGDMVFTDDVSLQVFMEHLKKLSVAQSS